jgi:hypothetical protein
MFVLAGASIGLFSAQLAGENISMNNGANVLSDNFIVAFFI